MRRRSSEPNLGDEAHASRHWWCGAGMAFASSEDKHEELHGVYV